MNGIAAGGASKADDFGTIEIAAHAALSQRDMIIRLVYVLAVLVVFGVDGDAAHAEFSRRLGDAHRNLAPIGD